LSDTGWPSWLGSVNAGAVVPSAGTTGAAAGVSAAKAPKATRRIAIARVGFIFVFSSGRRYHSQIAGMLPIGEFYLPPYCFA
jgi:hypothetical protein